MIGQPLQRGSKDRIMKNTDIKDLVEKIGKAPHAPGKTKTDVFFDADLNKDEMVELIKVVIFNMPGRYNLQDLNDNLFVMYGSPVSFILNPEICLELASLYPAKIKTSFTHALVIVEILDGWDTETRKYKI